MVALKMFFASTFTAILLANGAAGNSVTSDDLINNAKDFDKKEIVYSGEVIGDIMKRDEYAWINVSDGVNAIGVWATNEEADIIKFTGMYNYTGDVIEVTGIFNRACSEHGGDLDIHANKIEVTKQGHPNVAKINYHKIIISGFLLILAVAINIFILKKKL
jgi:hypothetical protein